jgi:hypothetical protein
MDIHHFKAFIVYMLESEVKLNCRKANRNSQAYHTRWKSMLDMGQWRSESLALQNRLLEKY